MREDDEKRKGDGKKPERDGDEVDFPVLLGAEGDTHGPPSFSGRKAKAAGMGDGRPWRPWLQSRARWLVLLPVLSLLVSIGRRPSTRRHKDEILLFLAIGSAPGNAELRHAARSGWLQWAAGDSRVKYMFFTEAEAEQEMNSRVRDEASSFGDMIFQPLPSGYSSFARRALFQFQFALEAYNFRFFLRIDDDSYLCLHRLLYELPYRPSSRFFWGKYWCKQGRNRADENFMLFSRDVVQFIHEGIEGTGLLPFDPDVTFAWNFGFWSWLLNLTIFDDIHRLDAQQQGYLTDYMHGDRLEPHGANATKAAGFCHEFLYAHHVRPAVSRAVHELGNSAIAILYNVPPIQSNKVTCPMSSRSFIPGRHSPRLPQIQIEDLPNVS